MPTPYTAAHSAALARMASILDHAADREHVSPEEFRSAIAAAIAHAGQNSPNTAAAEDTQTPEAFVLSLVCQLF